MAELNANFSIRQQNLRVNFSLGQTTIPAIFKINAAGTTWGSISGNIQNQYDLYSILQDKASNETVNNFYTTLDNKIDNTESVLGGQITALSNTVDINNQNINNRVAIVEGNVSNNTNSIDVINNTISNYGNIVTHYTSEFATANQGLLADTSIQPGDNISELVNNVGYITSASLPTVNNGTLDIQVNGTSIGTFTANQAGNTTANIIVPDSATWGNITGTLSNQTDLQNALNTKYDASNPSGFISGITSSDVIIALGYTPYNASNPSGFISGITSADVTNALGYIPYNSTNPSGFITASALNGYATETYVNTGLATKQATLVSGTNIRTINNMSLLGSGNISVGSVFIAVYGTTSVSDIQNAYSSQKSVFCEYTISGETQDDYDIILLPLTSYIERVDAMEGTTSSFHFTGYSDGITYTTYIDNTDTWGEVEQIANNYANDDLSNVSSISSSSAVYTQINNRANRNLSNLTSTGNAKFQAPLVSGTNIKTINNNSLLGSGDLPIDSLPSQTGQSGKYLTTNGTNASWATISGLTPTYDSINERMTW